MYHFKIYDGIDLYNRYLFVPVLISETDRIVFEEVSELELRFALSAIHVECYLNYFLQKHFDSELSYNQKRITNWRGGDYSCKYEEQQGYNFYTYNAIQKMIADLEHSLRLCKHYITNQNADPPFFGIPFHNIRQNGIACNHFYFSEKSLSRKLILLSKLWG